MRNPSADKAMIRDMSLRQRLQLARALEACNIMSQPTRRAIVVRELKREVPPISHSDVDKDHILNIIDACLRSRRGVSPLIEILKEMEGPGDSYEAVMDVLENIVLSSVLSADQHEEVVRLIADLDLDRTKLCWLALECLAIGAQQPIPDSVDALVDVLAGLATQVGRPFPRPVLEFIERVALQPKAASVRGRLQAIGEAACIAAGMTTAALEDSRRGLALVEPPERKLFVLVDLKPEHLSSEYRQAPVQDAGYSLNLWVCEEDGSFLTEFQPAEPRPLASIRADFMERLEGLVDPLTREGDTLSIELFLPRELRCEGFDQWARALDPEERIGRYRSVAVRCRERLSRGRLFGRRGEWEKHGSAALRETPAKVKIITLRQATDVHDAVFEEMHEKEGRFCLVVAAAPTDFADPAAHDELLQEAVDAGMPVGLWVRQRLCAVESIASELLELLRVPSLDRLPENVLKLRKSPAARRDAKHLGNHLTLFWDDPRRVPPKLRLGAPAGQETV
jgi:hypothetical protein